jgi:hypothetical protein
MSKYPIHKLQNDIFEQFLAAQYMESRLIVKNFGPIKDVNITLKNVNVFIGPQATGKSALAKLYTIFKAPRKFFFKKDSSDNQITKIIDQKSFEEVTIVFREYNIHSFLNPETEIEFESELHVISYKNGALNYIPKLFVHISQLKELSVDFSANKQKLIDGFKNLEIKFIQFQIKANDILYPDGGSDSTNTIISNDWGILEEKHCQDLFNRIENIDDFLSTNTATYIPAERSFVNIIKNSVFNLMKNNVPIPPHILTFGAEYEKDSNIKELNLDFIQEGLKYRIVNEEERIFISTDKSIMLTESSSGIQSVVPLLGAILTQTAGHRSFVIEEPELSLFPLAQYELIKLLESRRRDPWGTWEDYGTIHSYTTHSPYILSSLNNLLYAHKVAKILKDKLPTNLDFEDWFSKTKDCQRIAKEITGALLDPASFTAYQIAGGTAISIFNTENGLIDDNFIDKATDKINEDFEKLMELTK